MIASNLAPFATEKPLPSAIDFPARKLTSPEESTAKASPVEMVLQAAKVSVVFMVCWSRNRSLGYPQGPGASEATEKVKLEDSAFSLTTTNPQTPSVEARKSITSLAPEPPLLAASSADDRSPSARSGEKPKSATSPVPAVMSTRTR